MNQPGHGPVESWQHKGEAMFECFNAFRELWNAREQVRLNRAFVAGLAASALVIVLRAHPDHLAYFNPLAGSQPEHVLVDSNLDWGQDLYRLRDTLRARHVTDTVIVAYFGMTDLSAVGITSRELGLHERRWGWIGEEEEGFHERWA